VDACIAMNLDLSEVPGTPVQHNDKIAIAYSTDGVTGLVHICMTHAADELPASKIPFQMGSCLNLFAFWHFVCTHTPMMFRVHNPPS
jgi:hypothetical protein